MIFNNCIYEQLLEIEKDYNNCNKKNGLINKLEKRKKEKDQKKKLNST